MFLEVDVARKKREGNINHRAINAREHRYKREKTQEQIIVIIIGA